MEDPRRSGDQPRIQRVVAGRGTLDGEVLLAQTNTGTELQQPQWDLERVIAQLVNVRRELALLRFEVSGVRSVQQRIQSPTLTVYEACEILGCARTKLFELLKLGHLERADTPGRQLRIIRSSLNAYLTASRHPLVSDVAGEARRLLARPRAGLRDGTA